MSRPGAWDTPEQMTPLLKEKSALQHRRGFARALKALLEKNN